MRSSEIRNYHKQILDLLDSNDYSASELADALDLTPSGIRSRISEIRRLYDINIVTYRDIDGILRYSLDTEMDDEEEDADKYIVKSDRRRIIPNSLRRELHEMIREIADMEGETPKFSGVEYHKDAESLVILTSDWHIGKKIEDDDGEVIFDVKIAKRRIKQLSENIYKLSSIIRRNSDIDEVVILDLGDIVDGEQIYDSQYAHLDEFLPEQVNIATREKWNQILTLRNKFKCPIRYHSVFGNHGSYGGNKLSETVNFDTIVQLNLKVINDIVGYDDVLIDNSYSEIANREIRGNKVFMKHKCPQQTETASAKSRWGGWLIMYDWDLAVTGHWHHYKITEFHGRPIFYNGSIVGVDDYAKSLGVSSDITQMMFGISDHHLPSFIYPIKFGKE